MSRSRRSRGSFYCKERRKEEEGEASLESSACAWCAAVVGGGAGLLLARGGKGDALVFCGLTKELATAFKLPQVSTPGPPIVVALGAARVVVNAFRKLVALLWSKTFASIHRSTSPQSRPSQSVASLPATSCTPLPTRKYAHNAAQPLFFVSNPILPFTFSSLLHRSRR